MLQHGADSRVVETNIKRRCRDDDIARSRHSRVLRTGAPDPERAVRVEVEANRLAHVPCLAEYLACGVVGLGARAQGGEWPISLRVWGPPAIPPFRIKKVEIQPGRDAQVIGEPEQPASQF